MRKMHAQLLRRVMVEQVDGTGRLVRAGAAGFLITIEHVAIGHDDGEMRPALLPIQRVKSHKQPHFRDGVEIDIVLPDKLVDVRVRILPPAGPVPVGAPALLEDGFAEGHRSPERFRPHPEGQAVDPLLLRYRNPPFHVAG